MNTLTRRATLGAALLGTTALVAGCVSSTTNGVTTVTVNVAELMTYLSGAIALAGAFLGFPGISTAIGAAATATINLVMSKVSADIPTVVSATGGTASFTFNTTSVPAFISSVEADAGQLFSVAQTAAQGAGVTIPSAAQEYLAGLETIANAISALVQVGKAAAAPGKMSVADALALVHIAAPR